MKKTILSLIVCTLMITPIGALVGTTAAPNTPVHQPPGPAYAPPQTVTDTPSRTPNHQTSPTGNEDDLISTIIQQIDETLYLGYLTDLEAFGPRHTGSAACVAAAAYILQQFQDDGLWARYCHWNVGGYSSDNVEATINGTDTSSDDIYIICAHYDTVSAGPGADDDTSGTVAVIIAAYLLSQYSFDHTIKFVCFSGEEQGLYGSGVYAQQAAAQGWDIIGVLNCDMISYAETTNDGNNVYVIENTASEWLYTYTVNVNAAYAPYIGTLNLIHYGSMWGSDHNSFWDQGYDAIFYFEYHETPYYHSSQDTIDHINATYAKKNVRLILATLAELAAIHPTSNPPTVPTLTGPSYGILNTTYSFTVMSTDPDSDPIFYLIDWGDGTTSGWTGSSPSGEPATLNHSWNSLGTFQVMAKAKDTYGASSAWTEPHPILISDNTPPNAPSIDGPATVHPLIPHTYTLTATDPENQDLRYDIDWGDGNTVTAYGPYPSGQPVNVTHAWLARGNYTIRARATDSRDAQSNWTTFSVHVPLAYEPHTLLWRLIHWFQGTWLGELLARLIPH